MKIKVWTTGPAHTLISLFLFSEVSKFCRFVFRFLFQFKGVEYFDRSFVSSINEVIVINRNDLEQLGVLRKNVHPYRQLASFLCAQYMLADFYADC